MRPADALFQIKLYVLQGILTDVLQWRDSNGFNNISKQRLFTAASKPNYR